MDNKLVSSKVENFNGAINKTTTKRKKIPDLTVGEQKKLEEKLEMYETMKKIKEFNNNGKLTIVFFIDTFFPLIDGVVSVLDNYANRLLKYANVVVCVPKHLGKIVKKDYLVIGSDAIYFKFVNSDLAFPQTDANFLKYMKALHIDIIHIHSPFNMGLYATKLAKKLKIPIVATFHSDFKPDILKATKSKLLTALLLANLMKVFDACDEVWTMHQGTKKKLFEFGYKGGEIRFIPNATEYTYPQNPQQLLDKIDEKYGLKNQENVFLFVGRLVETKNVLFLARALKILKDKGVSFKMIYVGAGIDEKKLKTLILELGLQNYVIFTGKILDREILSGLYLRSDLFLFPSTVDMSSIVQIEAAAHKTPVVFIEGANTATTITNNVNGFTAIENEKEFANRIIQIIGDKENLLKIGENAYKQIYVNWDQLIGDVFEIYKSLIAKKKKENRKKELEKTAKKIIKASLQASKNEKNKKDR